MPPRSSEETRRRSEAQRRRWAQMSQVERRRLLDRMQADRPKERSLQWRQRHATAVKAAWQRGEIKFRPRSCRACGDEFLPNSGQQRFCSPECKWLARCARVYGGEASAYWHMLEDQGWLCALCRSTAFGWGRGKVLCVDHCHDTGRVRGFLCADCNTAIGRFGDDPARLRRAADYLDFGYRR